MKRGELADPNHPYWKAPRGVWLLVGSPAWKPYPCRCAPKCGARCPCNGRTDLVGVPPSCCALRAAETKRRNEEKA